MRKTKSATQDEKIAKDGYWGPSIYPNPLLPIDVMQHEKTEYNNKEIPQTISQLNTYEELKKQ